MICVYPADCTDFSTNGNGTIEPSSAQVMETLNGEYELQLVHPIDEAGNGRDWWKAVSSVLRCLRRLLPGYTSPRRVMTAAQRSTGSIQTLPERKPGKVP